MSRFFLTTLLLIAIPVPAQPAVGPEQTVRRVSHTGVLISGLVSIRSSFLLAWTEYPDIVGSAVPTQLFVQTIDARGELLGNPTRFAPGNPLASMGSDGNSALLVWSEGNSLRGAWLEDR